LNLTLTLTLTLTLFSDEAADELNRMMVEDELKDAHLLILANKQVKKTLTPPHPRSSESILKS